VAKIYFHEDYFDNVRLNGYSKILFQAGLIMEVKNKIKKKWRFFAGENIRFLCFLRQNPDG